MSVTNNFCRLFILGMELVDHVSCIRNMFLLKQNNRIPYKNVELRRAINVKNMCKSRYDKFETLNWNNFRRQHKI